MNIFNIAVSDEIYRYLKEYATKKGITIHEAATEILSLQVKSVTKVSE